LRFCSRVGCPFDKQAIVEQERMEYAPTSAANTTTTTAAAARGGVSMQAHRRTLGRNHHALPSSNNRPHNTSSKYNREYENRSPSVSPLRRRISRSPSPTTRSSSYRSDYSRSQHLAKEDGDNARSVSGEEGGGPVVVVAAASSSSTGINVKDFAMKLNNQVQKKSQFRPSWMKPSAVTGRHSSSNVAVDQQQQQADNVGTQPPQAKQPQHTLPAQAQSQPQPQRQAQEKDSRKIRATTWVREDQHRNQRSPSPLVTRKQSENERMKTTLEFDKAKVESSPTAFKKLQKEEVFEKAHFWRNQALQQTKQQTMPSSNFSSSSSSPRGGTRRYETINYDSPRRIEKQPLPSSHQLRYSKAVDAIRHRGSSRSPRRKLSFDISKGNDSDLNSHHVERKVHNEDKKGKDDAAMGACRQVTPIKNGIVSNEKPDIDSGDEGESSPRKSMSVKALGQRFLVGGVVTPDATTSSRPLIQKKTLSNPSKSKNTTESFQSKMAQFSSTRKKTSMNLVRSSPQSSIAKDQHVSQAPAINGIGEKCNEGDRCSVESLQTHNELTSSEKTNSDLRESSKERPVGQMADFQISKNENLAAMDKSSQHKPLVTKQVVKPAGNEEEKIRTEDIQRSKVNYDMTKSPTNTNRSGSVSQKAQFWINQQQSLKTSEPRGRRIGLHRNVRSSSQQCKPIETTKSPSKSSPSSRTKTRFERRSPSSPPILGRSGDGDRPETISKSMMSTSSDDIKNEYMHYISRNRIGRKGVDMHQEDSLDMDEQEQEDFRQSLRKSKAFTGEKNMKTTLESVGEDSTFDKNGVQRQEAGKSKFHSPDASSGSSTSTANLEIGNQLKASLYHNFNASGAVRDKHKKEKQTDKACENRELMGRKGSFRNKGLYTERFNRNKNLGSPVESPKQSIHVVAPIKQELTKNRAKDELGSKKNNKFSWPPAKMTKGFDGVVTGTKQNFKDNVTGMIQQSYSPQQSPSCSIRPFDEVSTPRKNAPAHNSSSQSPISNKSDDKLVNSPPKCARTTFNANDISSHTNDKAGYVKPGIRTISNKVATLDKDTSHVEKVNRRKDEEVENLQNSSTPKSSGSSVSRTYNYSAKALLTPQSIATTVAATDDSQLDSMQGMRAARQMESNISPISPIKEDSRNVYDHETLTVNTDTSSFLPVSEVKKRLWDDGEKLKWQRDEIPQARKSLFQNEKEASIFKSRYYHAAEIAQKHCMENKNSIPVPSIPSGCRPSARANEVPQRSSDVDVEKLLAKLSSIKRDDPDAALRAIDSILENHGGKDTNLDCIGDCPVINDSAESPILPPEDFEESSFEGEGETSSMYSDSDDSTVSSITNPTYMSGYGEPSLRRQRKQQSNKNAISAGRKSPLQSTSPSPCLKHHPYSKDRASELPPLQPRQAQEVYRKVKPLKDSNKPGKSRILRKSTPVNGVQPAHNFKKLPSLTYNEPSGIKTMSQGLEIAKSVDYKPPAKLTGGTSSSNQGLLSKLKDIGSDSDDKEDDVVESPKSPLSPGERLKRLAVAADRVEKNPETQHHLLGGKRRFLYPKRGHSLEKERLNSIVTDPQPQTNDGGDSAWLPEEHTDAFNEDFFQIRRENAGNPKESYPDECHPFDPFGGVAINDSFANEVLAEKFSRMEKAYNNL
jgi:hypothetical protein